jgi:site-specific DNA-methyltransferase (adenine-specific)
MSIFFEQDSIKIINDDTLTTNLIEKESIDLVVTCYDDDTDILTKDGWKPIKFIMMSDIIATVNSNMELSYTKPLEIQHSQYTGRMIKFNHKSIGLMVTPNHNLWLKTSWFNSKFRLMQAGEMHIGTKTSYRMANSIKWNGKNKQYFILPKVKLNYRFKYRNVNEKIPMDDWLSFLGWFISEGYVGIKQHKIIITQKNGKNVVKIRNLLKKLPFKFKEYIRDNLTHDFAITSNQLVNYLSNYTKPKSIPSFVMNLPPKRLLVLLESAIDGDGWRDNKTRRWQYYTTSKVLANQIQELILKVGINSKLRALPIRKSKHGNKQQLYKISSNTRKYIQFNCKNIEDIYYSGGIHCCSVKTKLLIVRRNGKIAVCGNSPPYSVGLEYDKYNDTIAYTDYLSFTEHWLFRCYEWLKDTGRICINVPFETAKYGRQSIAADVINAAKVCGLKYYCTAIWFKGTSSTTWGTFMSAKAPLIIPPVEAIIILYKNEWKRKDVGSKQSDITKNEYTDWTTHIWKIGTEDRTKLGHPAPFPIELPRRCIKLLSFVGDTILDPFMGSSSSLIAAYRNNRIGIGIELDVKYCELAKSRLEREIKIRNKMIF